MGIFGRKLPPIEVGDRFMKTGDRVGKVWEVSRVWIAVDNVPHARLMNQSETLAVSVRTLSDTQFFISAPPAVGT